MDGTNPRRSPVLPATLAAALALLITLAATPAAHAITREQAERRALNALGVKRGDDPVIVFRLDRALAAGARITQAGTSRQPNGGRRERGTGVVNSRMPRIEGLRLRGEKTYFFYADEGPFQTYQHPGRVALVGRRSGRVRVSERLQWPPLINGRLPAFMRSARAYHDRDDWAFYRPWRETAVGQAAENTSPVGLPMTSLLDMGLRNRVANLLAAERACSVRVSDTLGDFYDFGNVDRTRGWLGAMMTRLEDLDPGFSDQRYVLSSGRTPLGFANRVIRQRECGHVLLYLAGGGWASGPAAVTVGIKPDSARRIRQQFVTARQVRSLVRAHRGSSFTVIVDAPYANGFRETLVQEGNALVVATPSGSHGRTFSYLPEVELPGGQLRRHPGNPFGLLEFTNRALLGLERFLASAAEVENGAAQQAAGRSFLAWMFTRAFALGAEPPPPGLPPVVPNRSPVAVSGGVQTAEDTAVDVALRAFDPDGDALTFTITGGPDDGTLSGSGTQRTYTPDPDFSGADHFRFAVSDGRGGTASGQMTIAVTPGNDAPEITTSAGTADFTEDGSPIVVDPDVAVADVDDVALQGAVVAISAGFQAGDELLFSDQSGISGSFADGTLTLSGSASVADYEAALRTVEYRHVGDNPATDKTVAFTVDDGDADSAPATREIAITPVNDSPTLETSAGSATFTEHGLPVAIDPGLLVGDPDSAMLTGATVTLASSVSDETLGFVSQNGITGAYNAGTGVLTLSGTTTVANYQIALRSVSYSNTAEEPSTATRTVSFQVTDAGALNSAPDTRDVTITLDNDAPVVTLSAGDTAYTENAAATPIDGGLTVTDVDDSQLEGATVAIIDDFDSDDELVFTDQNGITGDPIDDDTLTLTGTATVAEYQAALRSVRFEHVGDDPTTSREVMFIAGDGEDESPGPLAVRTITITPVNDAPTVATSAGNAAFVEDGGPVAVDPNVNVSDPDSTMLTGASVALVGGADPAEALGFTDQSGITGAYDTGTGVLTLSGTTTVENYEAALRTVTYDNSSNSPSPTTRIVEFTVTDAGALTSAPNSRNVTIGVVNDAPVLTTTAGATAYSENAPATAIDAGLTVTDVDDVALQGAVVAITTGFEAGDELVFADQNGITGSVSGDTLTLTGSATVADYQTALRSVAFRHTADNPAVARTITFTAGDGDANSDPATKDLTITPVNDAPVLDTSDAALAYPENAGPLAADPGVTVTDADSTQLAGATVQVTTNFATAQDELAFANQLGITGSYDDTSGTLTLSGTASVADYQAALRAVTYENVSDDPNPPSRTLTFHATDAEAGTSTAATRGITLGAANDAATITTTATALAYTEGGPATVVDGGLTVADPDDANLEGAQVRISAGFQAADELLFTDQGAITGSVAGDTLTLTGTATVAAYQAALRTVEYRHSDDDPELVKTVEFRADDGDGLGPASTRNIDVTPVNDAPVVTTTATPLTYVPGDGAVAVDPGAQVTDADDTQLQSATVQITGNLAASEDVLAFTDQLGITGSYNAGTGLLTLTGTASVADYQTALRAVTYENSSATPSILARTVTFRVKDAGGAESAAATRDIALAQPPVVTTSAGATAYTENDPPTAIDGALTVTDDDDVALQGAVVAISNGLQAGDELVFSNQNGITGAYNALSGTLELSGTSSVANYQAALRSVAFEHDGDNPSVARTITFVADDGTTESDPATKAIAITAVNDGPRITTTAGNVAYTENDPPVTIDGALTVTDPDNALLTGATVTIDNNQADDELSFTPAAGITGSYVSGTGVLTLSGSAAPSDYQAVLRTVQYENTGESPAPPATRTIEFAATDADGGTTPTPATRVIDVTGVNDAPVVTTSAGATSYTEGDPATTVDTGLTVTDVDDTSLDGATVRIATGFDAGDELVFVNQLGITGVYNTGTGVLTLTGTSSLANYQTALRSVAFRTTHDNPATAKAIEVTVDDGDADSAPATKAIAVTRVNDAPTVTTTAANLAYTENAGPVAIDGGLTVTDPDSTQLSGATVAITGNHQQAQDDLGFANQNGITGTYNDATGMLTLSGTASLADYQTALRSVTYTNISEGPTPLTRTISFTATDSDGAASNAATRGIAITAVNDPPTAVNDTGTTDEDTTLNAAAPGVLANDTDVDPGDTKIVDRLNGSTTLTGTSTEGATVTINANGSYTYNPGSIFQGLSTGQTDTDSFTYRMSDGEGASSTATVNLTITGVSDAPVGVADSFDAIGNTALSVGTARPTSEAGKVITGSVLSNDTDIDTPQASLVAEAVTNAATTLGGTITIESDGNFTYHPDDADVGVTDTFTYRVCDSTPCNSGTVANGTGTLSLPLAGQVWYVQNNEPAGGDGTSDTPFDTIAEAEAASGTGDTVYVFDGDNTAVDLETGFAMEANERLIGEHNGVSLSGHLLHAGTTNAHPTLAATGEDVVVLAAGATVDGLNLDAAGAGGGISHGPSTSGVTINDVNVADAGPSFGTQPGVDLNGTTGTHNITDLTVATNGATGVDLNNAGVVNFAPASTITIAATNAKGLEVNGTNLGTSTFDSITATGSNNGGVSIATASGTTTFGDLSLTTTSGTAPAFSLSTAGTVSVPAAATANVSATGGPAVEVTGTSGAQLAFDVVSSAGSAGDGIDLAGLDGGTFTASGGTISGASGIGFDLAGGNGTVTYPGALNNGSGPLAAEITGRSGGAVTLSGAIADTNDAGGGISLATNTGGTTTFSNASKILNTTTADAVSFSGSDGHTLTLSGGGLDIDTTTGRGVFASSSGTLVVSGAVNTIDSVSATALSVANTDIGAGGATFQRISSGNATAAADPANGILLNNTGAGAISVTGTGTAGSGGTIQNATGTGVSLTSVPGGVSLTRSTVVDSGDDGIGGSSVGGLSLDNASVTSNGNDPLAGPAPDGEHGVDLRNLTGTSTFTNSDVSNNVNSNVVVSNASGTLNLNVTGGTYSGATGGMGDGIFVEGTGTGSHNLNIQGPITFSNNEGDHVQHGSDAANTTDSDVTVNNTTMTSPAAANGGPTCALDILGGGITVSHGGNSNTDLTLTNNNIQNSCIGAIAVGTTGSVGDLQSAQVDATITGNTIGTTGVAGSGSVQGNGIFVDSNGNGLVRTLITGNTIRQWTNRNGIHLDVLDGDAEMSATVRNNILTEPNSAFAGTSTRGMTIQLGAQQTGDSIDACLDIGHATDAGLKNQVFGTGEAPQPDIRYLHEGPSSIVQLAGYGGPAAPSITDIANYLQPRNNIGGTPTVTGIATASGATTTTAASCPLPAN